MPRILVHAEDGRTRVLLKKASVETELPALWLRARSPDPSQRDTVTGQRLMNPHQLPDDLHLLDARFENELLHLSFSDGFSGHFDPEDLVQGSVLTSFSAARAWRISSPTNRRITTLVSSAAISSGPCVALL